ncbi:hypothetical protein KI387_031518, partial [Taxus chinensis]
RVMEAPKEWLLDIEAIKEMVDKESDERFRRPKSARIYEVPHVLKDVDREAYAPRWVSLGPYQHNAAHLLPMNTHKLRAVKRMMDRAAKNMEIHRAEYNRSFCFEYVIQEIKNLDSEIKDSYEKVIGSEYTDEMLACMMTIDGCFILEILRTLSDASQADKDSSSFDPIFNRCRIECTGYGLLTDMLLLENQIPLFVLIKLLELELGKDENAAAKELYRMLVNGRLAGRLFYPFVFKAADFENQAVRDEIKRSAHLLDLVSRLAGSGQSHEDETKGKEARPAGLLDLASCLTGCAQRRSSKERKHQHLLMPTVSELHEVGLKFKSYEGGAMNISFAILMDELVNTERDVALLRKYGIIQSYTMGSDRQVAKFFNDLRKGIVTSCDDVFMEERISILDYYHSKYRVMLAEFVKEHFSRPWRAASVGAAIIL